MATPDFSQILQSVTVSSHDDGWEFTDRTRVNAIKHLLHGSSYHRIHEDNLFLLYGTHRPVRGEEIILVSSHIDCVYLRCFCQEDDQFYKGTFDNSFTNAAVIFNMLAGQFPDNVFVAFTGDEEKDNGGCHSLMSYLSNVGCGVRFSLVTDVTNVGWDDGASFTLENDLDLDLFTAYRIVEGLDGYKYAYIHESEPDETLDYASFGVPSMSLCAPVSGNMHSDEGVSLRKSCINDYCRVLALLPRLVIE